MCYKKWMLPWWDGLVVRRTYLPKSEGSVGGAEADKWLIHYKLSSRLNVQFSVVYLKRLD